MCQKLNHHRGYPYLERPQVALDRDQMCDDFDGLGGRSGFVAPLLKLLGRDPGIGGDGDDPVVNCGAIDAQGVSTGSWSRS